jgi:hypothetical protein
MGYKAIDISAIQKAIMYNFNSLSLDIKTSLSGGLYYKQAPKNVSYPYGTFSIGAIAQDHDSGDNTWNIPILFNIYSDDANSAEISTLTYDLQEMILENSINQNQTFYNWIKTMHDFTLYNRIEEGKKRINTSSTQIEINIQKR